MTYWIPMNHEPPPEGVEVILLRNAGRGGYGYHVGEILRDASGTMVVCRGYGRKSIALFSHWMPLPEPPRQTLRPALQVG